jgi:hypothetical protein
VHAAPELRRKQLAHRPVARRREALDVGARRARRPQSVGALDLHTQFFEKSTDQFFEKSTDLMKQRT